MPDVALQPEQTLLSGVLLLPETPLQTSDEHTMASSSILYRQTNRFRQVKSDGAPSVIW